MAISLPLRWLTGMDMMPAYPLQAATLLGGFLFGLGAAVNGGCTFSTLGHLAEGNLSYLATIVGFVLGAAAATRVVSASQMMVSAPPTAEWPAIALVGLAWLWGLWQVARLWQSRPRGEPWLAANRYRVSTSAILIGLGGGTMLTLHGSWTFAGALRDLAGLRSATALQAGLAVALLSGMLLSARLRRTARLRRPPAVLCARRLGGGALMGAGSALIPGGNAMLVLLGIPSLSPHALPAYGMILLGVATALALAGNPVKVRCEGGVCRIDA